MKNEIIGDGHRRVDRCSALGIDEVRIYSAPHLNANHTNLFGPRHPNSFSDHLTPGQGQLGPAYSRGTRP